MLLKKGIASAIIFLRERLLMHRIALQYFRGGIAIGNVGDLEGTGKGSPTQHANVVVGRAEASLRFYDAGRHQ